MTTQQDDHQILQEPSQICLECRRSHLRLTFPPRSASIYFMSANEYTCAPCMRQVDMYSQMRIVQSKVLNAARPEARAQSDLLICILQLISCLFPDHQLCMNPRVNGFDQIDKNELSISAVAFLTSVRN